MVQNISTKNDSIKNYSNAWLIIINSYDIHRECQNMQNRISYKKL